MDEFERKYLGIAKSGDVVFLECKGHLSEASFSKIKTHFDDLYKKTGVTFVILDESIKLARVEKTND